MLRFLRATILLLALLASARELTAEPDKPPPLDSSARTDTRISITPAFSGYCRPGCFLPLTVKIETHQKPVRGPLVVSSDTMVLNRYIELPAPSVRELPMLLAPHSIHRAIEAKLVVDGSVVAQTRLDGLQAVAPKSMLIAVLDGPPARFQPLLDSLPGGSQLCRTSPQAMPRDYRGYEAIDLMIAADLATELDPAQREALAAWLRRGGRILVIVPANGFASMSAFWRTFLPAELAGIREQTIGPEHIRRAGLAVLHDEQYPGLAGFKFGMGRVLLSAYGQERGQTRREPFGDVADENARRQVAAAIVRLLDMQTSPRTDAPLLAPDVYEIFEEHSWPDSTRRSIGLAVLGYIAVMAVALRVVTRERPAVCAGMVLGFSALFTGAMYFAVLPRSSAVCQVASVASLQASPDRQDASTPAGAAIDSYVALSSITGTSLTVDFHQPVKPLFYSETMLARGPVQLRLRGNMQRYEIPSGAETGAPTCFEQNSVAAIAGRIVVEAAGVPPDAGSEDQPQAFAITNNIADPRSGKPVALEDVILTDGANCVYVGGLPNGSECSIDFSRQRRLPLGRTIWDRFGPGSSAGGGHRQRMLERWRAQHPPGSGIWLLGWSDPAIASAASAAPGGQFLKRIDQPTLWQIEIMIR